MGAQSVGNIAVNDCHEIDELIHGLAGKSDTVPEFDRGMFFFYYDYLNWGNSACLSTNDTKKQKKQLQLFIFVLGKLAKVLLMDFITTHWEHFWRIDTSHWLLHRCAIFTAAFTAYINSTQIAVWASTWYFATVTKAHASLCKCAHSPEPWDLGTYRIVQKLYGSC